MDESKQDFSILSSIKEIFRPSVKQSAPTKPKGLPSAPDEIKKANQERLLSLRELAFFNTLFEKQEKLIKNYTTFAKTPYFSGSEEIIDQKTDYLLKERVKEKQEFYEIDKLLIDDIPLSGTLEVTDAGLFFLKVDPAFVEIPFATYAGKSAKKTPFIAHAPVISEKELPGRQKERVTEIGESFSFEIKECVKIYPEGFSEIKSIFLLRIKSIELEHLREKYGLPSKLHSQDFSIVFAFEDKIYDPNRKEPTHYLKVNPAQSFA